MDFRDFVRLTPEEERCYFKRGGCCCMVRISGIAYGIKPKPRRIVKVFRGKVTSLMGRIGNGEGQP